MREIDFRIQARSHLAKILDFLETHYPTLDIEDDEESIVVELPDKRQFLINIHPSSQQIWLSSPFSGAHHYAYQSSHQEWIDTRAPQSLLDQLHSELEKVA